MHGNLLTSMNNDYHVKLTTLVTSTAKDISGEFFLFKLSVFVGTRVNMAASNVY